MNDYVRQQVTTYAGSHEPLLTTVKHCKLASQWACLPPKHLIQDHPSQNNTGQMMQRQTEEILS